MSKNELLEKITGAVIDALRIKLTPGEVCPCCGRKQSKRNVNEQMRAANRENLKKANAARGRKKGK